MFGWGVFYINADLRLETNHQINNYLVPGDGAETSFCFEHHDKVPETFLRCNYSQVCSTYRVLFQKCRSSINNLEVKHDHPASIWFTPGSLTRHRFLLSALYGTEVPTISTFSSVILYVHTYIKPSNSGRFLRQNSIGPYCSSA